MYVSARSDYALRAMLAVAAGVVGEGAGEGGELVKAASLAEAQDIPFSFLQGILLDLRRAGLLFSHRGSDGGYALTRPAQEITVGDVLRAVGGSLTTVRGLPAERAGYHGVAAGLTDVWLAVHGAIATVVDSRTLADLLDRHPTNEEGGVVEPVPRRPDHTSYRS
ncbi:RrF2 family transcriptional regulator [Micromonospora sp. 067-2]|uniref:RrF2 family transcriptional regulator n=1 Tax=Micromonospora sp. 067-2 TaxID=2789270 RepID=UPI00397DDA9A